MNVPTSTDKSMTQKLSDKSFEKRRDTDQEITRNNIQTLPELHTMSDAAVIDGAHANCASKAESDYHSFEYDVENVIFDDIPVEHFQF